MNGLHIAILHTRDDKFYPVMEITQYLINAGIDINLKTRDSHPVLELQGVTPLHLAASIKDINICDYLVKSNADIGIKDAVGRYAFDETICGIEFHQLFVEKYEDMITIMKKKEKEKRKSLKIMTQEDKVLEKFNQLQKEFDKLRDELKENKKKLKHYKKLYKTQNNRKETTELPVVEIIAVKDKSESSSELETNRKSNQPKDEINEDRMDLDITDTKKKLQRTL